MSGTARLRVLIADDHGVVRAGLRTLLEGEPGLEVVGEAESGEDAVRLANELRPDVVVIDVSMPGIGGFVATERITREAPPTRVLVLSMHDDAGHLARMLEAGASGYVLKQSAPEDLVEGLRTVGAGLSYVDPRLAGNVLRRRVEAPEAVGEAALSGREKEVLLRVARGQSNKSIARELHIGTRAVETCKARVAERLGLRGRSDIVRFALHHGWLGEDAG